MKRFFWAPKTYVKSDRKYNFTHHPFVSPYNFIICFRAYKYHKYLKDLKNIKFVHMSKGPNK